MGSIAIDQGRIDQLLAACPFVQRQSDAHAQEHSLEVHLPFLQAQLDEFKLIPLVVGDATPEQVEQAIDFLWGDASTLIVISSARLSGDKACGYLPVSGLLLSAKRRNIRPQRVDLRNSGDTAGPRDQVVGYGAWLFHEA
jgi:predicted class III extradiol MEMO1 family dioxygenase